VQRPDYKKLRSWLKKTIVTQEQEHAQGSTPFVAISKGWLESAAAQMGVRSREWGHIWKQLCKDCGLVDDGTGTNTATKPEYVAQIQDMARSLGKYIP